MRTLHRIQPSLPLPRVPHKHAQLLARIAHVLDSLPQLEEQVLQDLVRPGTRSDFGRDGMSAQQVLRVLVLYLLLKTDYEQLEFHLADSPTYRSFCLLGVGQQPPKRAALQRNVSCIRSQTLQMLHRIVVEHAIDSGVESGTQVRTDTTPVAAPLRPPTDSALLGDAVRVLARLLKKAQKHVPMSVPNRKRRVSHRTTELRSPKLDPAHRESLYFQLLQDTKEYIEAALFAAEFLEGCDGAPAYQFSIELRIAAENALCIVDQTERRVLLHQEVPATHKQVSLFERHADILTKRDEVVYGHKVCLTFGKTGVVLAAEILRGNPADSTLAVPALEQVQANTGKTPHDAAMDRGFSSKDNVAALKERGVQRVSLSRGRGIDEEAACGNRRIRRKLHRFRAGAEGLISWLKRSLAMGQSRWKGEEGFWAYVWGVVMTASLQAIAQAG
jgi:IS5 family transposase